MKTTCLMLALGSAAAIDLTTEVFTEADCKGTGVKTVVKGDTCTAGVKYTGTCKAAVMETFANVADCTGTATKAPAVDLTTTVATGKCVTVGPVSSKSTCSAGAMTSPGAWSMVVAAASMIAVMKQ